jgi:hypothetical protein
MGGRSGGARAEKCRRRAQRSAGGATQWSTDGGAGDGPAAVERRRAQELWWRRAQELWWRRWGPRGGATSRSSGSVGALAAARPAGAEGGATRGGEGAGEEREQGDGRRWCRGGGACAGGWKKGEKKTGSIPYWNN